MNVYELPLTAVPQRFTVSLQNITYFVLLTWNAVAQTWVMDIADSNDTPLAQGLPLVTGVDLLGQCEYLGLGGAFIVESDSSTDAVPTFSNLGSDGRLYFVTQ